MASPMPYVTVDTAPSVMPQANSPTASATAVPTSAAVLFKKDEQCECGRASTKQNEFVIAHYQYAPGLNTTLPLSRAELPEAGLP